MTPTTATSPPPLPASPEALPEALPPNQCPDCGEFIPPEAFAQLRPGGTWLLVDDCPSCKAINKAEAEQARRERALDHYCHAIPPRYRNTLDGGETNLSHPDWQRHHGPAQLAFLRRWDRHRHDWAAVIGPGGHLKSRVIGLHARILAVDYGESLQWLNGSRLGWATSTRFDDEERTRANHALRKWRTFPGVLLLDDLWKGQITPGYIAALYALLEHRNAYRLPILWTANTHPKDMADHIDADNRDPIIGRLLENSHLLDLNA